VIVLEGECMLSKSDLHIELKEKLGLPIYYGKNLDALWDCLTGWIDLPIEVEWKDFDLVEDSLGEYANKAFQLFQEADGISIKKSLRK